MVLYSVLHYIGLAICLQCLGVGTDTSQDPNIYICNIQPQTKKKGPKYLQQILNFLAINNYTSCKIYFHFSYQSVKQTVINRRVYTRVSEMCTTITY